MFLSHRYLSPFLSPSLLLSLKINKKILNNNTSLYVKQKYIYQILFINSSVDGHLVCLHLLAIVNNATMNIGIQYLFKSPLLILWGYTLRSGTVGLLGNSMFNFLRNCQNVFQTAVAPAIRKVSNFSASSSTNVVLYLFIFIIVILLGVRDTHILCPLYP